MLAILIKPALDVIKTHVPVMDNANPTKTSCRPFSKESHPY